MPGHPWYLIENMSSSATGHTRGNDEPTKKQRLLNQGSELIYEVVFIHRETFKERLPGMPAFLGMPEKLEQQKAEVTGV